MEQARALVNASVSLYINDRSGQCLADRSEAAALPRAYDLNVCGASTPILDDFRARFGGYGTNRLRQ